MQHAKSFLWLYGILWPKKAKNLKLPKSKMYRKVTPRWWPQIDECKTNEHAAWSWMILEIFLLCPWLIIPKRPQEQYCDYSKMKAKKGRRLWPPLTMMLTPISSPLPGLQPELENLGRKPLGVDCCGWKILASMKPSIWRFLVELLDPFSLS